MDGSGMTIAVQLCVIKTLFISYMKVDMASRKISRSAPSHSHPGMTQAAISPAKRGAFRPHLDCRGS